ncbi:hypothetical protein E8E01_01645 [Methylorubrum populi]|uniref:hypothetical protein n=1 Tax=Methylorubrum populi TaxID=223967 RepID=UPI00114D768F|nr:hypothetical protein [Methylorubrum populi]QDI79219.1 hypothetical protein E8E01_01645 [Methylorubrum populi]
MSTATAITNIPTPQKERIYTTRPLTNQTLESSKNADVSTDFANTVSEISIKTPFLTPGISVEKQIVGTGEHSAPHSRVEAAVIGINDVSVIIECVAGNESIEILVPVSIVSKDLRKYGQPIWVGMSHENGIRGLEVLEREVNSIANDKDLDDIEAWIENMPC